MMKAAFFHLLLSSGALLVAGAGKGLRNGNSAAAARILQAGDACDEETIFVDSQISDLGNPIGGCYEQASVTTSDGFPFYSLGGGASVGQAWISVGGEGSWEIGIIQEVDEATGDVTDIKSVCTSLGFAAEGLSGPTDVQLDGVWECVYFQNGLTNRLAGDFTGVECGCGGRTTVEADEDSDDGGVNTTAIAIAVLVAIAVLAVVVCACFIRIRKRKAKAANVEAPKEDHDVGVAASS